MLAAVGRGKEGRPKTEHLNVTIQLPVHCKVIRIKHTNFLLLLKTVFFQNIGTNNGVKLCNKLCMNR